MKRTIEKLAGLSLILGAAAAALVFATSEASANTNSCAVVPFVPVSCPVNTLATGVQEGVAVTQDNLTADFLAAVDSNAGDARKCTGVASYSGGALVVTSPTVAAGVSAFPPASIAGVYPEPPFQRYNTVFIQCL